MSFRANPYVLLIIAPIVWAGNFVVGRGMHELINPWALTFLRWGIAALLLSPWAIPAALRFRKALWAARWPLLGMSISGVVLFQALIYEALRTTPAINSAVVMATMPIVIPVIAYFMFRDRISPFQALGIGISVLGAFYVVTRGDIGVLLNLDLTPGDVLTLACVVFWSFYSNAIRLLPAGLPPVAVLWVTAVIGVVFLLPIAGIEATMRPSFDLLTPKVLGALAYVSLGPSITAFLCWNVGVAGVGPTKAGLFIHLIPIFTVIFATTLLGESLHTYHLIGASVVALGIVMVSRGRLRRAPA